MNTFKSIFKRLIGMFKRCDTVRLTSEFNLRVRVITTPGYSFDKYTLGGVFAAKRRGSGYAVSSESIGTCIPGTVTTRQHIIDGAESSPGSWSYTRQHIEVLP